MANHVAPAPANIYSAQSRPKAGISFRSNVIYLNINQLELE